MLKSLFVGLGLIALVSGCSQTPNSPNAKTVSDGKHFGNQITADKAIIYDSVMTKMAAIDSLPMKVSGKVKEVCQKKGCWMTLVSDQPGYPEMRVTFKDYAFFMPKDLSGKRVVIDGFAYVETTPVDVLRHYAEDAGKTKEEISAINQPKREVSFEAAGVLILD